MKLKLDRIEINRIEYVDLNARQKENYNYHKISALLADYGFTTLRLTDDWQGADFIAQHIDGDMFLKVQLKTRLTFMKKYRKKDLYIAFPEVGSWYLYPHDSLLEVACEKTSIENTESWQGGAYHVGSLGKKWASMLEPYKIGQ